MGRGTKDSFGVRSRLSIGSLSVEYFSLAALARAGVPEVARLPFSLKVLVENLLRFEDGRTVTPEDVVAVCRSVTGGRQEREIAFRPARVLMQDFTGVPALVDLAAMRDWMRQQGSDPRRINPLTPVDLVVDHSIQVDQSGTPTAFAENVAREFERNHERYRFLKWGQQAFANFRVVPPGMGIVHQVNLEYLARVVFLEEGLAYPDTLVGTDSHTTMINGIGVLGWGVGGIEAEAAMLGQPIAMLIPEVVGFKLTGELPPGATATDLVLTVTEMLRRKGVVGKFVEFYGPGLRSLSAADRATIANMAPEYGATVGFFPVDEETLRYLRFTGREDDLVALVEAYTKEQGLFRSEETPDPIFSDTIELDLSTVEPSVAGPRRPQDRVPLKDSRRAFRRALVGMVNGEVQKFGAEQLAQWVEGEAVESAPIPLRKRVSVRVNDHEAELGHGSVVIAAITSCTNTSNPTVMIAAGLLAKKAVERGLRAKPWVKTSLAPGSRVVIEYLREAGLLRYLEALRFHLVGYGCTTCIGNSGPLPEPIARAIQEERLVAVAVLSGNRNFEGRVHPLVRANYLASPPLVVAYALAGTMDVDLLAEPLGTDPEGRPVYLKDIWPTPEEIQATMGAAIRREMFRRTYADVFRGEERWNALSAPTGELFAWDEASTYIRRPPFFEEMPIEASPLEDIRGARALLVLGDSVTTDHISPAGSIPVQSPAGQYLIACGVAPSDFNSYGARRGNHEVMIRGTFANIRLRNLLVPDVEGGWTVHFPDGERVTIFEAAERYRAEHVPLLVIAGKEYGSGSSRDWAAKGPRLLGVRAVLAESFERIHRSNLIGMGILPLQFREGENRETLGLTGREIYDIAGLAEGLAPRQMLTVRARREDGSETVFSAIARVDTPIEVEYYRHGGILPYVLRELLKEGR
ncbi:MAG: aconitate hydratase AcnA [Blastocatellia bacterium]|nr:aconitate hydratase AcnA [Blastocatellia bacterium]MCS7157778.1 aconitate hydratase AcnA [Blastocatellia bacterium]MCX7753291.1 aconitate hydratase AcnA [Blastocatellia bacterium]MDW8168146.1 aconitate hydratase AcnA [Acidobacteriota bacterium]MDW8257606.1 aconitate hydratase AcnA [Acidobacteriota bacterium]